MTDKDKKDIVDIFNEGMEKVVLPAMDSMKNELLDKINNIEDKMATKDDIQDIQTQLDSIERKVEAQQLRSDRHGTDIEKIKKVLNFA